MGIKASGRLALIVAAGIWLWFSAPLQALQVTGQTQAATGQPEALGKPISLNNHARRHSRRSLRHARSHARRHHRAARSGGSETKSSRRAVKAETRKSEALNGTDSDSQGLDGKVIESRSVELPAEDARASDDKSADTHQAAPPAAHEAIAAQPDRHTSDGNESAALSSSVANARAQLLSPAPTDNATIAPAPAASSSSERSSPAPSESAANADVVPSDQLNAVDQSLNDDKEPVPAIAMAAIDTPSAGTATPAAQAGNDESAWMQTSMIGKMFIAFGGLLTLASAARMLIA